MVQRYNREQLNMDLTTKFTDGLTVDVEGVVSFDDDAKKDKRGTKVRVRYNVEGMTVGYALNRTGAKILVTTARSLRDKCESEEQFNAYIDAFPKDNGIPLIACEWDHPGVLPEPPKTAADIMELYRQMNDTEKVLFRIEMGGEPEQPEPEQD